MLNVSLPNQDSVEAKLCTMESILRVSANRAAMLASLKTEMCMLDLHKVQSFATVEVALVVKRMVELSVCPKAARHRGPIGLDSKIIFGAHTS